MCGRFTRQSPTDVLVKDFAIEKVTVDMNPSYNVSPGQDIAVVVGHSLRELVSRRWGLIPHWAKDPSIGYKMINARSETVGEKPSFKLCYRERRCLVLADGFYEWKKEGKVKCPYYIRTASGRSFAMAGIWDSWDSPAGTRLFTCSILTTEANSRLSSIHNRMPVILSREDEQKWLGTGSDELGFLESLMRPYEEEELDIYMVSDRVNSTKHDDPSCVKAQETETEPEELF